MELKENKNGDIQMEKRNFFQRLAGHFCTITRHRHQVIKHCKKAGILWQGLRHDLSKYTPTEFIPGVKFYTGHRSPNEGEREVFGYSKAWMHHKGRNRHHFEYWVDYNIETHRNEPVEMPYNYVAEMYCDRLAASKIYNGKKYKQTDPLDYFSRRKPHRSINLKTRDEIEKLLVMTAEAGEDEAFKYIRKRLKEEKKIKKAYRARLHAVNPEDDPDGFKRLREAYEEALKYARQKEEEPENLSPAEEFISRCEQLYKNFYRRIDEQEWEKLFSEDICISLESGEEVRQRFLVFLMENFRLPSPVWKKIDQTFSITGNRKELLELFPEPYVDFLQQVVRYNGALNYELFEGDVSEDVDDYIEHYHKLRQYADLGMRKEAWEEYHFIEANYDICHPYILLEKARLLYSDEEREKQEEGGEIFRSLAKKYPQEERIVCCYGRYCQEKDTWDGTIALYDAVLEAHPESFLARTGKMESILHEGRYREARESILDLLEESPVDERLVADLNKANVYVIAELEPKYKDSLLDQDGLMELAWCYYQNSRFEDGIALMDGFVPDEEHYLDYHNLKGRIFLTVNKDAEALEHLVPWLHAIQKLRPDGTKKTTRQMARLGYAYYTIASAKADLILDGQEGSLLEVMDYIEKAVEAEQDFSQKVSYYHTAADIWRRKKEYAKMFDICDKIIALDPQYYPAYLLRQEACLYLGRYQEVINDYQRATALYPYHARPYCTLIRMYLSFGEQDRVKDILQLAKENGANSDELELLRARYIAIRAKSRKDLEKALSILEKLEKKGWSLQSEMDEEEWAEIVYRKAQILTRLQEETR